MEKQESTRDDVKQKKDNEKGVVIASCLILFTAIVLIICIASGFFGLLSTTVGNP